MLIAFIDTIIDPSKMEYWRVLYNCFLPELLDLPCVPLS